jgi:hypothetical protein
MDPPSRKRKSKAKSSANRTVDTVQDTFEVVSTDPKEIKERVTTKEVEHSINGTKEIVTKKQVKLVEESDGAVKKEEQTTTWTFDKRLGPKPRARTAVLDRLNELPADNGTRNFAALCLTMWALHMMTENYYTKNYLVNWRYLVNMLQGWPFAVALWQSMLLWSALLYAITTAGLRGQLSRPLANTLFYIALAVLFFGPVFIILHYDLNFLMGGASVAQSLVNSMKLYSYWSTNWFLEGKRRRIHAKQRAGVTGVKVPATQRKTMTVITSVPNTNNNSTQSAIANVDAVLDDDESDPNLLIYPSNLTLSNFLYFLSCPSLVYEVSFPKTNSIRWTYFFSLVGQAAATFFIEYLFFSESLMPVFENAQQLPYHRAVIKLSLTAILMWLLSFYGIFHCILGMIAELTRFADREFYLDWWNAQSFDQWWRRWNRPVYKWMLRHIYTDSMHTVRFNKGTATFAVFLTSAVLHEYVIAVGFRVLRPILSTTMLIQIGIIYITKLPALQGTQLGNLVMWLSLIVGQPMIWILYCYSYLPELTTK